MERFAIRRESDVTMAVLGVQSYARHLGLPEHTIARLSTAVSELANNIVKYCSGCGGDVIIETTDSEAFLSVQVRDNGPGIGDLKLAMQDHYSTSGTLGLGLPGVRRIVDRFGIVSVPGEGTVVSIAVKR